MEFLGVLRKELVEIPGVIQKEVESPAVIEKKRCHTTLWNIQR